MPEGDTIHRAATRLRPAMQRRRILAARHRDPHFTVDGLLDRTVTAVEARGKHLLMHTDGDLAIHSHMGMTGSWHIYVAGEPWKKRADLAELTLEMSARESPPGQPMTIVCFSPKLLELLTPAEIKRHRWLSRLGPDLLVGNFDLTKAIGRIRVHDRTAIGEAVMNQSIVCGIGNVYKSEVLFLTATHPLERVGRLSNDVLEEIFDTARRLMERNLQGTTRRTRNALGGKPLWVYGRSGQPCYKCGTSIALTRQGDLGRTTYWCPNCQPPADPSELGVC